MTEEKYTREIREGIEVLVYPDGTVKRADNGLFLSPPASAKITTSEQGREMQARRTALARQRAVEGIDEAAIEAGKIPQSMAGSGEGWKAVIKHVTATLLESTNLRGQAEAANFLGKAAQLTADEGEKSRGTILALVSLFDRIIENNHTESETIEGDVKDV